MTGLGSFGGRSLKDVAWGWRGPWGLLLSPCSIFCLLLVFHFFSFRVSLAQGGNIP